MGPELRVSGFAAATFLTVAAIALAGPTRCHAQSTEMLVRMHDDGERIRAWTNRAASRDHDARMLMGGLELAVGGLATGLGIYSLIEEDAFRPLSSFGVSAYVLTIGVVALGLGVYHLITSTTAEGAAEAVPEGPLDERTIGRLEGRMQHAAENGRNQRITSGILGGGLFLASAIGLTYLGATGVDPEQFMLDYAIPAGLGLGGLVLFVTSFFESAAEGDWREYRRGLAPAPPPDVAFHVTPNGFALTF